MLVGIGATIAVLLAVAVVQLGTVIGLLRRQTGMIQAASDLNLEHLEGIEQELRTKVPSARW